MAWEMAIKMSAEPYGLTAQLQNRYERAATIHSQTGQRLGRIWYQQGRISYDKSSWAQWRIGNASTYGEALAVIGG